MPRATTAACEVMPPVAVRMPFAASMPWMSSGVVSLRTRITRSFCAAALDGVVGVEHRRADRRARRGRRGRWRSACSFAFGIEPRVQQLIERRGLDAQHRFLLA